MGVLVAPLITLMVQYDTTSFSMIKQCTINIMKHCLHSAGRLKLKFLTNYIIIQQQWLTVH